MRKFLFSLFVILFVGLNVTALAPQRTTVAAATAVLDGVRDAAYGSAIGTDPAISGSKNFSLT